MLQHERERNDWKKQVGEAAAQLVEDGMVIGLGTGTTAAFFVRALAQRIQEGLRIAGAVPSSQATHDLAQQLGIPLTTLDSYPEPELYIDGADEIDPQLRLLKGAVGALLREKIVAYAARRFIVIADITKQVSYLGEHFPVPVEIIPFALNPIRKRLQALGAVVQVRQAGEGPFITDNHNIILDCTFPHGIANPAQLDAQLHHIPGVVETGFFLDRASQALISGPQGVQILPA